MAVEVSGEDVLIVLFAAVGPTKRILAGGFEAIFGLEPEKWGTATAEQKNKLLNPGILTS